MALLFMDAVRRSVHSPISVLDAAFRKLAENKSRWWPKFDPDNANGAVHHIKEDSGIVANRGGVNIHVMRYCPDAVTGEQVNIGVFVEDGEMADGYFVQNLDRVTDLFGVNISSTVREMELTFSTLYCENRLEFIRQKPQVGQPSSIFTEQVGATLLDFHKALDDSKARYLIEKPRVEQYPAIDAGTTSDESYSGPPCSRCRRRLHHSNKTPFCAACTTPVREGY